MRRRVVVTGIGCVTPLGTDVETMWRRLLAGESGVGYTTLFDASNFPTKISAEVRNWDLSDVGENPADWKYQGRHTHFAVGAAKKAMADSGLDLEKIDPTRFGVYTGSGEGQQDFKRFTQMMVAGLGGGDQLDLAKFIQKGLETLHPIAELEQEPNMPAGHLASLFNAQGPNLNCLTACAASSQAVGEAVEIIRRGEADVMLAGGTHTMIHPFGVTGFNLLTALSTRNDEPTRASRPFDRDRDGFVLGEGAGMVILEALEHAQARGAKIYGELVGYGSTADAFRITDTHPEGRGAISCIKMAHRRRRPGAGRRRLHQRPRHQHHRERQGGNAGHQEGLRRPGVQDSRFQHEEHDGPPDRRRRGHGVDHLPAGHPRQRRAADDQLRDARPRVRSGLHSERCPRAPLRRGLEQQFRVWRAEHRAVGQPVCRLVGRATCNACFMCCFLASRLRSRSCFCSNVLRAIVGIVKSIRSEWGCCTGNIVKVKTGDLGAQGNDEC